MNKQNGLTMFELLITIGIVGIVLTIALPSLASMIKENKLVNTMNTVTSITMFARGEAIKRGDQIIVCRTTNNKTCLATGSNIIVVHDKNNDGAVSSTEDDVIRSFTVIDANDGVNIFLQTFTQKSIVFSRFGAAKETGRIVICDNRGAGYAKASVLNMGGQLRTVSPSERSGVSCSA